MILVMFVQRRVGIGLDFFSVAWALVITVVVTRFIGQRIDYERPLGQVVELFRHEITGPRRRTVGTGGVVRSSHVRIGPVVRPRKRRRAGPRRSSAPRKAASAACTQREGDAAQPGNRRASAARRDAGRCPSRRSARRRRGRALAGDGGLPKYEPDIALRSIDGHLTRTGTQVMAWYRLAAQAWSFRSDSQREVLIRQIAAQLGELQGRWLHLRVTTRPYPVHMWAESFDNNALGRLPDVPGALGWDGFLEGEQRHLMGLSMSDKEVFLGIEVSGRSMLDRWVERAAPVLGKVAPAAVRAEMAALASEVGHLDVLVAGQWPRRRARARRRHRVADAPVVLAGPARARARSPCADRLPAGRPKTSRRSPTASTCSRSPTPRRCGSSAGCAPRRSSATSPCLRSG